MVFPDTYPIFVGSANGHSFGGQLVQTAANALVNRAITNVAGSLGVFAGMTDNGACAAFASNGSWGSGTPDSEGGGASKGSAFPA